MDTDTNNNLTCISVFLNYRLTSFFKKTSSIQEDNTVAPSVEFFNPKMRAELEDRDAAEMKKTGAKGAAPGGDTWVWLTSYSRVPVSKRSNHLRNLSFL